MKLTRRRILRGTGAALALPWLESVHGLAGVDAAPLRLVYVYVPNGLHMPHWRPDTVGDDAPLPEQLPPLLEPLASLRDSFSVLSGLSLDEARNNGDGPGDHARASGAYLTCEQPLKADGTRLRVGISADQIAARALGGNSRFRSLQLGCEDPMQSGQCDSGYPCAYSSHVSWATPHTPLSAETNPRLLFDRLFGAGLEDLDPIDRARRLRRKHSILDLVRREARELSGNLGASDRRKLEEYLEGVRELERRLDLASDPVAVAMERPTGTPEDFEEHATLLYQLLALALETDSTRVATFMLANEGSNKNYRQLDVSDGHHELSHHGEDPHKQQQIARINLFHLELFAGFLRRLARNGEDQERLLDRTLVVYGSAIADGNTHAHGDLPILLAGGGEGLRHGRHRRFPLETDLARLHGTLLDRLGVPQEGLPTRRFHREQEPLRI
jgi:hypothetical protein